MQDSSQPVIRNKSNFNPTRNWNEVFGMVIDFLHKQKFEETNQINKSNIFKTWTERLNGTEKQQMYHN